MTRARVLNSNVIKMIAVVSMFIDHLGVILLPQYFFLRCIGRLAFPVFAFMIAEGAKYTRSKLRYFLSVFLTGLVCQTVNFFFNGGDLSMCSLITFSISILLLYLLFYSKKIFFEAKLALWLRILLPACIMLSALAAVYALNKVLDIDYGFWGCLLPVFAGLVDFRGVRVPELVSKFDSYYVRLALFAVGVLRLSMHYAGAQYLGLLSVVLLAFYSEKRGTARMKYFFYAFFPAHLALLYGVYMLIMYIIYH